MTADMWRGMDSEPYARDIYAEHIKQPVKQIGFAVRDFGAFKIGYSPDGLVGDDGLLETKAPRQNNHLTTVVSGNVPTSLHGAVADGLAGHGPQVDRLRVLLRRDAPVAQARDTRPALAGRDRRRR